MSPGQILRPLHYPDERTGIRTGPCTGAARLRACRSGGRRRRSAPEGSRAADVRTARLHPLPAASRARLRLRGGTRPETAAPPLSRGGSLRHGLRARRAERSEAGAIPLRARPAPGIRLQALSSVRGLCAPAASRREHGYGVVESCAFLGGRSARGAARGSPRAHPRRPLDVLELRAGTPDGTKIGLRRWL